MSKEIDYTFHEMEEAAKDSCALDEFYIGFLENAHLMASGRLLRSHSTINKISVITRLALMKEKLVKVNLYEKGDKVNTPSGYAIVEKDEVFLDSALKNLFDLMDARDQRRKI